jgi:hypothetical protein
MDGIWYKFKGHNKFSIYCIPKEVKRENAAWASNKCKDTYKELKEVEIQLTTLYD